MSDKIAVHTTMAPAAIGPYSQAILAGELLYCSGQIPLDPTTGKIVAGNLHEQAHRMFKNLQAVVNSAGAELAGTLRTTLYLTDMEHFATINAIYSEYFSPPYPARSTIQVARLPMNAIMEIDAIVKVNLN